MPAQMNATTQDHLDILDIKDNFVILKNGNVCAVIQTTAVNFDLLSEIEQDAIIAAFSMLLNSITFAIQIVIRSRKLDISKYVDKVRKVEMKLTDPLLKHQAEAYRKFVQEVIKVNEVLDKRFYVVIPSGVSRVGEEGAGAFDWVMRLMGTQNRRTSVNVEKVLQNGKIELGPKVDHVTKEFNRIGIKTKQLSTQELVELYFDIYNPSTAHGQRIRTNVEDYKTAIVNPAIIEE
jgi:type IV secretory pathway VirB4 component